MTAGLTAKLAASLIGDFTGVNDLSSVLAQINQQFSMDFQPGTGLGKANKLFADTRTLAASGTESLDVAGALADPVGGVATFTKIKAIMIKASAANTNDVVVGGAAANSFNGPFVDPTDKLTIAPGDFVILTKKAGWDVTGATGDLLKVANGGAGTGVDYSIILIGE
jgi:hypothetical protein